MDFEGQKLAEIIFHILIISFGAVGWVIGYFQQDFTVVFQAWLVGLVLSVIVSTYEYIIFPPTMVSYVNLHIHCHENTHPLLCHYCVITTL